MPWPAHANAGHRQVIRRPPTSICCTCCTCLHALSDPTRMAIVETLRHDLERACGAFPVEVAPSTLSHHLRVLREAGVIRQREEANRRLTALRRDDLNARFPGLIDMIMDTCERHPGVPSDGTSVG